MSPKQDRAEVAGELIRTLDPVPDAAVEEAWDAEVRRRIEKLNAGTARTTLSLEDARHRVRAAAFGALG